MKSRCHEAYKRLLLGLLLGILAGLLILGYKLRDLVQLEFGTPLVEPTLRLVHTLLSWIYSDVVYQPDQFLIGTSSFQVIINYSCTGLRGIIVITGFLTIYCWLFSKKLRFPQAFWLFPLGIIAIWLANAARIVMIIMIGTLLSPEVAMEGFHTQFGWIAIILVALGLIVLSHQMRFFMVDQAGSSVIQSAPSLTAALLVPMMVLIAVSMVTLAFSGGFDALYPLRVVAVGTALWYYRKVYRGLGWTWSWQAVAIGVAVFLLWMLPESSVASSRQELAGGIEVLSTEWAAVWLIFRILGSVIILPLVEELAFRGYLLRRLISPDFEKIRLDHFTWLSFIVSSLLFGFLHERWLAGTLAGMAYALALYRRGQLGDAVLAHATTNALVSAFVLLWALVHNSTQHIDLK